MGVALLTGAAVVAVTLPWRTTRPHPRPIETNLDLSLGNSQTADSPAPVRIRPLDTGDPQPHPGDPIAVPVAEGRPDWLTRLLSGATHPGLSHEAVGRWIERNGTNAESLLAAAQTEGGQEHLLKALELYPHDPRVLCASIRLNDSPEAKRERLERFKAADPENALPYYLSAREHLKRSEPEKAIGDLLAASQQGRFDDYTLQAMQSAEELYLSAGVSPGEAKAVGGASVLLPHLAQLKDLTVGLMDLRQQYVAAGDGQSADNLTRFSLQLAEHLTSGD